ncbi:unnamed protein product [Sympodiomycopsis kandeliae]
MTSLLPALSPALVLGLSSLPRVSAYCSAPVLYNCASYYPGVAQTACYEGNWNEQEIYRQCLDEHSDDEDGSGLSKGAMAGIIVGAIVAFVIMIVTLVLVLRRRRRTRTRQAQELPTMSPLELERGSSPDAQAGSPMKEKRLPRINLTTVPLALAKYPSSQDVEQSHQPTQQGIAAVNHGLVDRSILAGHLSVRPTYLTKLSTLLACFWALYFVLVLVELIVTAPSSLQDWSSVGDYLYPKFCPFSVPVEVALQVLALLSSLATTIVMCFWTRIAKRTSSDEGTSQGAFPSGRTQTINRSLHGRFIAALATLGLVTLGLGAGSTYYFTTTYIDSPQDEIAVDVRRAALGVFIVSLVMHLALVANEFVALRRSRSRQV